MTTLGDLFPDGERRAFAKKHLIPGCILRLWCDFTAAPKFKYLAIVATEPEPIGFFINSRVPAFIRKRPALNRCQLTLKVADYPFLQYDSYLDCRTVIDVLDTDDILDQLTETPSRLVGELTPTTKAQIVRVIASAPTVSEDHRNLIRQALSAPDAPCR